MGCPDPLSDSGAGNNDPDQARSRLGRVGAMKDIDRNDAGGKANQPCKDNKPPIVFSGKTR
jgi:hypothetical protein